MNFKKTDLEKIIEETQLNHLPGHSFAQARRRFLISGLKQFSGFLVLPSLLNVVARQNYAFADECGGEDGGLPPFITINLEGGASLSSNFVPMDVGGQILSTYNKMGLGSGSQLPIERAFGNVPFAGNGISKILTGIKQTATQSTLDKTAFIGVNVILRDDNPGNKMDITGMISAAGRTGSKLPKMGIRGNTSTGVGLADALVSSPVPLIVNRFQDIVGAAGGFANSMTKLSKNQQISLFKFVDKLSGSQSRKLASLSGGENLQSLMKCAGIKNNAIVNSSSDSLDVRKTNAAVSALWKLSNTSGDSDKDLLFSSMVFNTLNGNASSASLELFGHDYHDGSRTSGDAKDLNAGILIGKVLQTAALMNSKLCLYVTTDGACGSEVSDSSSSPWTSDRGNGASVYLLAYDPAGRPTTKNFQLGHFTSGQVVDETFVTGGSPERTALAVFANYLQFAGRLDLLSKMSFNSLSTGDLDKVILFG